MLKTLVALLIGLCLTGCGAISTRTNNFKMYIKHEDAKNFVITNDKHPSENYAVIVKPHEATLNYSLHF